MKILKFGSHRKRHSEIDDNDFIYFTAVVGSVVGYLDTVSLMIFSNEFPSHYKNQFMDEMEKSISSFNPFDTKQRGQSLPDDLLSFSSKYKKFVSSLDQFLTESSNQQSNNPFSTKIELPVWLMDYAQESEKIILLIEKISKDKGLGTRLKNGKRILKTIKYLQLYNAGGPENTLKIAPLYVRVYSKFKILKSKITGTFKNSRS